MFLPEGIFSNFFSLKINLKDIYRRSSSFLTTNIKGEFIGRDNTGNTKRTIHGKQIIQQQTNKKELKKHTQKNEYSVKYLGRTQVLMQVGLICACVLQDTRRRV